MSDLHALARAISSASPNTRAFALAVADILQPVTPPAASPLPTTVKQLWTGDFETGDFAQYDGGVQQAVQGRGKIATGSRASLGGPTQARAGTHYFESEVHSGDNIYGGERCEAVKPGLGVGDLNAERWLTWSFFIPTNLPISVRAGLIGGQLHSTWDYGQSCEFFVSPSYAGLPFGTPATPHLVYGVSGGPAVQSYQLLDGEFSKAFDLGPLAGWQGRWVDVVKHYIWKEDTTGTVEVWLTKPDASWQKVVDRRGDIANRFVGHSAYLKIGLNRIQTSGLGVGYCWYDDVRVYA